MPRPYMPYLNEYAYLITPDDVEYLFHDGRRRFLREFSGQGQPGVTFLSQRAPYQHGETVLDYRLNPRNIAYSHSRIGCNRDDYWANRRDQLDHFRINRQLAKTFNSFVLRYIIPNGTIYDIDVLPLKGPEFEPRNLAAWDEASTREALRWYAGNPIFYNPTPTVVQLTLDICDDLIFPFDFPFVFCGDSLSVLNSVTYLGDWASQPIVRFQGPWNAGLTLEQVTTGEKLRFIRAIPAGEVITIDTNPGKKTVKDSAGRRWVGLSSDSDLATFHLAPNPEAPNGVNAIAAYGTGGVIGLSKVTLEFYTRWTGF